jgi:pilus assembly protein Flp/PilA
VAQTLSRFWREDEGQDLVEYALLVLLVAVALIGALSLLTGGISTALSEGVSAL